MIAQTKLLTVKPGTKELTKRIKKALMKSVKSPSVRRFIGNVSRIMTGLIKVLTRPKIIATITAVQKSAILTPGRR